MGNEGKWNPGEPANRQGAQDDDAGQSLGATSAFGIKKPGGTPAAAFDDDLMSLLAGVEKKRTADAPAPASPAPVPAGPVVHEVAPPATGSESQDDLLSRLQIGRAHV